MKAGTKIVTILVKVNFNFTSQAFKNLQSNEISIKKVDKSLIFQQKLNRLVKNNQSIFMNQLKNDNSLALIHKK